MSWNATTTTSPLAVKAVRFSRSLTRPRRQCELNSFAKGNYLTDSGIRTGNSMASNAGPYTIRSIARHDLSHIAINPSNISPTANRQQIIVLASTRPFTPAISIPENNHTLVIRQTFSYSATALGYRYSGCVSW